MGIVYSFMLYRKFYMCMSSQRSAVHPVQELIPIPGSYAPLTGSLSFIFRSRMREHYLIPHTLEYTYKTFYREKPC